METDKKPTVRRSKASNQHNGQGLSSYQERITFRRNSYQERYDVTSLNPNDEALFEALLQAEVTLEALMAKRQELIEDISLLEDTVQLKKISDLIRDTTNSIAEMQKTLAIDRKTRKQQDAEESPVEYLLKLKNIAYTFLDERLQKVYCPECKVMVFRFYPVHQHSGYKLSVTCSQCGYSVAVSAKRKDAFFDIPAEDRAWRKRYPMEIEMPSIHERTPDIDGSDDLEFDFSEDGNQE